MITLIHNVADNGWYYEDPESNWRTSQLFASKREAIAARIDGDIIWDEPPVETYTVICVGDDGKTRRRTATRYDKAIEAVHELIKEFGGTWKIEETN